MTILPTPKVAHALLLKDVKSLVMGREFCSVYKRMMNFVYMSQSSFSNILHRLIASFAEITIAPLTQNN